MNFVCANIGIGFGIIRQPHRMNGIEWEAIKLVCVFVYIEFHPIHS